MIEYEWRGNFANDDLNRLHAEAFEHEPFNHDWGTQVERYSLGWVCARDANQLVGFVNVPWDGDTHAFIIDTIVSTDYRRRGIGKRMIEIVVEEARAARCEWLHVDFEDHLRAFYLDACGFKSTPAGTIAL